MVVSIPLSAQQDTVNAFNLSLEELMNVKVSTASKYEESIREAPGVITIIDEEDIVAGNCRDLIDVFNMVPGFTILTDLLELQTLGVRGLYGFEGRALIMVDGMQLNENFFGTFPLGNDFPIALIDHIEIVRGPGSVVYGGAAELAVINIITKKPESKTDATVEGSYGLTSHSSVQVGHRDIFASLGQKLDGLQYSLYTSYGESAKATSSDRLDYLSADPDFPAYDINMNTTGNRNFILGGNVEVNNRVKLDLFYKNYINFMPIVDDSVGTEWGDYWTRGETFQNFSGRLSSKHNLGGFKILPAFETQYSLAWFMNSPMHRTIRETGVDIWRVKPSLVIEKSFKKILSSNDELVWLLGGEYSKDFASQLYDYQRDSSEINVLKKPSEEQWGKTVNIWDVSWYTSLKYSIANLHFIGGLRYDYNELTNAKYSPRLVITYVRPKFHGKLLYSEAFRAPNIANIASDYSVANYPAYQENLIRESTKVYEIEIGYKFTKSLFATINLYSQYVEDIIEFNPDYDFLSTNAKNANGGAGMHGSEGVETEIRFIKRRYRGIVNFMYTQPGNNILFSKQNTDGKTYMSPTADEDYFNGVPSMKFYTNHMWSLNNSVSLTMSLLHYTKRYEYRYTDFFAPYSREIPGQSVLNAGVVFRDAFTDNLDITFMINDIFNQQLKYVAAFDSYWVYDSTPFSSVNARGTEFTLKIKYRFVE